MPENNDDAADGPAPRTVVDERSLSPMRRTIANGPQESDRNAVHVTASRHEYEDLTVGDVLEGGRPVLGGSGLAVATTREVNGT